MNTNRTIRVFISSTFRDMQAERDYLVKFTFPQLRRLCEARGVTWGEVDLRWGITDEEKAEGKVLPLCLEEIHRCRPYFIGLLGERYGWIPDSISPEVIEREAWLCEHVDERKSVTELEILHGVLNNPQMAKHAFFYFRDPKYVEQVSSEQREDFTSEDPESAQRLKELKERIRHNHFPVRENYADPKTLGELVLKDFTELIDLLFPEGEKLDPLDRDALDHQAFAQSRARVYIGREEYFDRLDEHVNGDGPPLVILGESGSGKSALLANWSAKYRENHPDAFVIQHYIGATPYSADWAAMLRRIMGELKRHFDIQQEIPEKPDELRSAFANWLHMAAAKGKVVLILDALNQLEDRDGAPDLVWLPPVIPSNIRLVLSTLPGRALDDLNKRAWPTLQVKRLERHEREQLIRDYLAQYTKALSPARVERIATADQTANPLYLRALLDELRVYGDHFTLDQRIEHYLAATAAVVLYEKILERYEEDYEHERAGLVRDTMSLLCAARRGLSEAELMDLLGTEQGPLPRAHWSPLFLAAEQSLVSRSGLIGFGHDYLRQAVRDKYLPVEQDQHAAHLRLADYFETQNLGARKLDELPWQLAEAKSWKSLSDLLTDGQFFAAAWDANEFEVKAYWSKIETNSPLRVVDAYRLVPDGPAQDTDHVWRVVKLLRDTGHHGEALSRQEFLVDHFRQTGDGANLEACLGNQAHIFYACGELDEAMRLYKEQERMCRELGNKDGLSRSLAGQALILQDRGELDEAMRLHKEEERICRKLGNKYGLSISLGNQANIFHARGELDEAMRLHKEEERICRELGNKNGLQRSLGNQANIFYTRGELDEAMRLCKEQERICRELGNRYGLRFCLGTKANIFYARCELDEAMLLYREQERICRELGNRDGLAASLINQALLMAREMRRPREALPLAEEAYRIATAHGLIALAQQIGPILNTVRAGANEVEP